jgi:type I restriction-modification system DNA methylase subunit
VNHGQIVSFIWGVADLIRDTFKRGKYQDVILPLTVLRRLDCVLAPTKEKVLQTVGKFKGKLETSTRNFVAPPVSPSTIPRGTILKNFLPTRRTSPQI